MKSLPHNNLGPSIRLSGEISKYLEWMRYKGYSPFTVEGYSKDIVMIVEHFHEVGIHTAADLTVESISVLETWLVDKKLKPRSRAKSLTVFKNFCKYLKEENKILFDISKKVTMPKFNRRTLKEVPSKEEIATLLSVPDQNDEIGLRDFLILSLLYHTGMRANEIVNVFTRNIDFVKRSIKILGKGGHNRFVYFPLYIGIKLKAYVREMKSFVLFPSVTRHHVSYLCGKYFRKAGMIQTGAHILRYTIATHLFERGINVRVIQTMLGHKSVTSTYEYILPRLDYLKEIHKKHHPFEKGLFNDN